MPRELIVTENITIDSVIDAAGGWFAPSGAEDPAQIAEMRQVEERLRSTADALLVGRRSSQPTLRPMKTEKQAATIRRASTADAGNAARLLHDFNTEFDDPSPGPEFLTARLAELIETGDFTILLAGEGPDGIAVLRFRPALWEKGLDAHLEELYVVPERRGQGLGRSLLEKTMEIARRAGAVRIDLGTEETDTDARGLYASAGFVNHDSEGAQLLFYERDL